MNDVQASPRRAYAVVANGVITPDGTIVQITDRIDAIYPIPLFIHEDKAVAERRKETFVRRIRAVKFYDGPKMKPSQPILGVVQIALPAKKAGKPMTAEHKAALQAARNKTGTSNNATRANVPSVAVKK